jgi:predicted transcriptional regulator
MRFCVLLAFSARTVYGFHMTHPGSAIRAMREAQGLTLRDLADLSDASYSYLSLVERGERTPTDRWLRDVTDALAKHMLSRGAA